MSTQPFALVTGCGEGGIGEGLVNELLKNGFQVIATVLPNQHDDHLSSKPQCHVAKLEVTDEGSIQELYDTVDKITGGRLDVLCNNAGILYRCPAVDLPRDELFKIIHINLIGPIRIVSVFHRMLVQAKGVITLTCSVNGIAPAAWCAQYNATKAGLSQFGDSLRIEMKPFGVRVVNVITGETRTNIAKTDKGREIAPSSIFAPLAPTFKGLMTSDGIPGAIPPHLHAQAVIHEALKARPRNWLWVGPITTHVWLMSLFPREIFDFIIPNLFRIGRLQRPPGGGMTWSEWFVAKTIRSYGKKK